MPRVFVVDSSPSVSVQRATAVSVFAGIGRSDTIRWRGVPLSPLMGDPDVGTSPFFAVDSWVPLRAYTADQVDTLIGDTVDGLTFGDLGGLIAAAQIGDGTVPLSKLASTVYTQTEVDAALSGLAGTIDGVGETLLAHLLNTDNPHEVTAEQVGLGDVENVALSMWAGSTNLTTLGTITAGAVPASLVTFGSFGAGDYTFPAALTVTGALTLTAGLPTTSGGTGITTWTTGDLPYASGANVLARLPIGTATGQFLRVSAGVPSWSTLTLPATLLAGRVLITTSTDTVGGLSPTANRVLVADGSTASFTTLPYAALPSGSSGSWSPGVGNTVTIASDPLILSGVVQVTQLLELTPRTDPLAPVNGNLWPTTVDLRARIGGVTRVVWPPAAGELSGTVLAATVVTSSLTAVGTLTGLVVSGVAASVIGHTALVATGDADTLGSTVVPALGVFSISTVASQLAVGRWSATVAHGASIVGSRSKSAVIGGLGQLSAGDRVFTVAANGDDGVDLGTRVGSLRWEVDAVTVAHNRIAGRLVVSLATGLADDDSREIARFTSTGILLIGTTSETGATAGGIKVAGTSILGSIVAVGGSPSAGATLEANSNTGSSTIVPVIIRARSRSSGGGWLTGAANYVAGYDFYFDDTTAPPGASVRGGMFAFMEAAAGDKVGLAFMVGPTTGPTVALTLASTLASTFAGSCKVTGAFGCNGAAVQTAVASGGALAAYAAGANGLGTGANMSALHALVVTMRAALVANGTMS